MKLLLIICLAISVPGKSQSITGKWTTIDDNSGKEKSVVEIYLKGDKVYGKVTKIIVGPGEDPDPVCDKCPHDDIRYDKKIIGMEIIRDLTKTGEAYSDGTILDPEEGKVYRCKLWAEGNELKVRGYWGPFFRTQTWKRVQ
jgi:uncharacterized protein (DUF2147 family)